MSPFLSTLFNTYYWRREKVPDLGKANCAQFNIMYVSGIKNYRLVIPSRLELPRILLANLPLA